MVHFPAPNRPNVPLAVNRTSARPNFRALPSVAPLTSGSTHTAPRRLLVSGVWATNERIYVVDMQVPAVRVYDWSGDHLFDIGREGEGPGEYREPWLVATRPNGDIVVSETGSRLHVYSPDGTPLQTFNSGSIYTIYTLSSFLVSAEGVPYRVTFEGPMTADASSRIGTQAVGPEGAIGDPIFPPSLGFETWCLEYFHPRTQRTDTSCNVPFAPHEVSELTPDLAWVVGISDQYRFEIHASSGHVTRVENSWTPVPVSAEEVDYERGRTRGYIRQWEPGWDWNGPEIPDHKPAYSRLMPDRSARIWVVRQGPSRRVTDERTEDFSDYAASRRDYRPCWVAELFLDAFDTEGRYLGELRAPHSGAFARDAFVQGDVFVAPVFDESGTIMVKRYRLVLPGR